MSAATVVPSYLNSAHAHLPLPRRKTVERVFELQVGRARLRIEAGNLFVDDEYVDQPLPHGRFARLCLIFINTTALQKKTQEIFLGESITSFVAGVIGRDPVGSDIRSFRAQFDALAAATLKIGFQLDDGTDTEVRMYLAERITQSRGRGRGQKIKIELSDQYFRHLQKHAVPLDMRAISMLSGSALAIDMYCWLGARLYGIQQSGGQFIGWAGLHEQFGSGYAEIRNFRRDFIKTLPAVQAVYPSAKIKIESDKRSRGHPAPRGLRLFKSAPPIAPKKEADQ